MSGRLIAVVGPSGVGKDSVIDGIVAAMPGLRRVRRVITRDANLGGEDFDAVSDQRFAEIADQGGFCLHWGAHGLRYGLPRSELDAVTAGEDRIANLSRAMLAEAAHVFEDMVVLHVTASPDVLAKRLTERGRETDEELAQRLSRAALPLPEGLDVIVVGNDGPLEQTVARAVAALQPVRA